MEPSANPTTAKVWVNDGAEANYEPDEAKKEAINDKKNKKIQH